ncbi:LAMI_0B07118g1_1 [Lachancea mirantina]|uniref:LAMI_0B07118g1_1 n=1 Tax=Lachancea mirantina TaxID=1230905 RepID=A0A1G4IX90_9SACH|nr:LAMI_0B07118g1_1 [Lachancea mirantina]
MEEPEQAEQAIQLINENKEFNAETLARFNKYVGGRDVGFGYHVISVFGSQSSGKSTLLNALFRTKFDTMNAQVKRQQTTKGIWLGHTRNVAVSVAKSAGNDDSTRVNEDLFVLDVEGSDGAERGEDQDFERKAALFAIAVSEVLIVNMWEQQVGLYQGNNMALLKTVFEVNLSLFGQNKDNHKMLLLFVIRDHVGVTPLTSLKETLETELNDIWSQLAKPAGTEHLKLQDFFDLEFTALAHKLLQPEEFIKGVESLGDAFTSKDSTTGYLNPQYHHNLPLDGWIMYAENCWDLIETNKDLDLPTQQILVAKFKTEEIANQAFQNFEENYHVDLKKDTTASELAEQLKSLKRGCFEDYDAFASRYVRSVYQEQRKQLSIKTENKIKTTLAEYFANLSEQVLEELTLKITAKNKQTFADKTNVAKKFALDKFRSSAQVFTTRELVTSLGEEISNFEISVEKVISDERDKESNHIIARAGKKIHLGIKEEIFFLLAHPQPDLWDQVLAKFNELWKDSLKNFETGIDQKYDFGLELSESKDAEIRDSVRSKAWTVLYELVHDYLSEDNVVTILREKFENLFRFDENDSPRLWKNEEEIDSIFRVAREKAYQVLDILAIASTTDGVELVPDVPLRDGDGNMDLEQDFEDDEGVYHSKRFAHILSNSQKARILQKFKRQANTTVIEAKRSTIKTTTRIPLYIYALLVALGWNEFLIVIRNPLFVTLLLILGVAFYFVQKFNLWAPIINVAELAVSETRQVVKDRLRGLLLEEPKKIPVEQDKVSEEFEMQEFAQ